MTFKNARFEPGDGAVAGTGGYVYHDRRIVLAVNIALATRRPLLVTGPPGSGKSTLAADVAERLNWGYLSTTITSRIRLDDLVARYDAVRRLSDAQSQAVKDPAEYLIPGAFWWAFDRVTAAGMHAATDPRRNPAASDNGTVVLLDEIDKAEPDLPNDLLEPLDTYTIVVPGHGRISAERDVLVVLTSNGERSMPPAFLRRCVVLELGDADPDFFAGVATSHFGARTDSLYTDVANRTIELARQAAERRVRQPSMAEYLDTVRACVAFDERPGNASTEPTPLWSAIEEAALRKSRETDRGSPDG